MKWISISACIHTIILIWVFNQGTPKLVNQSKKDLNEKIKIKIISKKNKPPTQNTFSKKEDSSRTKQTVERLKKQTNSTHTIKKDSKTTNLKNTHQNYSSFLPGGELAFSGTQNSNSNSIKNDYGGLSTNTKIDIDQLLTTFEVPFTMKTNEKKNIYSKTELFLNSKSKNWTIKYLYGNDLIMKVLLYKFSYIRKNLTLIEKIMNSINKKSITIEFRFLHKPNSTKFLLKEK